MVSAPQGLRVQRGRRLSRAGCVQRYTRYSTARARRGDLVVLGHGFLRDQARMAGLARALAGAGLTAVTLEDCGTRPWDARPIGYGLDMIAIANAEAARRVVYAGFSAGGLAALTAGRADPRTLGVVALDLVDAHGLGVRTAAGLERPLIGLVGAPSSCNADNNGLAVYAAAPRARLESFPSADHCDFEDPTDWLCRLLCGRDAHRESQKLPQKPVGATSVARGTREQAAEAAPTTAGHFVHGDFQATSQVRRAIIRSAVTAVRGLFSRHPRGYR